MVNFFTYKTQTLPVLKTPLELTNVYAIFVRGSEVAKPIFIPQ